MPRWRRRWYIASIQITLIWDDCAWAFGVWVNRHQFAAALGYLYLDIA